MKSPIFHLPTFDGPLDLLLYLLKQNKVEIQDISISEILDQYLAYLEKMHELDFEVTGDFIAMASKLIYIKSQVLLPVEKVDDEGDPRSQLIKALFEYQLVKDISAILEARFTLGKNILTRGAEILKDNFDQKYSNTPDQLRIAMGDLVERLRRQASLPSTIADAFGDTPVSINEKIEFVLNYLQNSKIAYYSIIILTSKNKKDLVALFLAILELSWSDCIKIETSSKEDYILSLS